VQVHKSIFFISFCCILCAFRFAAAQTEMATYFPQPQEILSWHPVDSVRVVAGEDLFQMIDGGADMYLEYGFQRVAAVEYQDVRERSIRLELYEMTAAAAAFGVYSINKPSDGKIISIGNEGVISSYYLMFWKGRFLVYLSASDTSSEVAAAILSMAKAIDPKLGERALLPSLVQLFPQNNLQSVRYLRGMIGLSSLYTFDTKNIFDLQEGAAGVYPQHTVLLFSYASKEKADTVFLKAKTELKSSSRFTHANEKGEALEMIDLSGKPLCVTHYDKFIVAVVGSPQTDVGAICKDAVKDLSKK
jgi:hypothetical protein